MRVAENILPQPESFLRLEQIETQRGTLRGLMGATAFAATVWSIIFGGLVWTVVDFDYSWSPLKWLAPIGVIIVSSGTIIDWRKRKLCAEKELLRSRTSKFVLNQEALNNLKPELRELANKALSSCGTHEQALEVLVAYHAAALELVRLDVSAADATQCEALQDFKKLRNELRRIRDEVGGERELKLM